MGVPPFESENPGTYAAGAGKEHFGQVERQPALGRPIRFQVWFRRGLLGPSWGAICGALASGELRLSADPLLRLALLVFLVDVVWGGLWSALAATDWATPLRRWQSWRQGSPVRFLPYTSPNGPAGRLALTWGQLCSWWAELVQPTLGPTLKGVILLLPLGLVIAGVLGTRSLLMTLAAITTLQFAFTWTGGDASSVPGLQGLFEIALPWLAGHALLSPLIPASIALALAYALSYAGGLRLTQGQSGLTRWNLGQVAAVPVLVLLHQPLMAGVSGLLLVGQAMLQPGLFDAETEEVEPATAARFLRWVQPWIMAAMLAAAWGVSKAGAGR